jgi:uncharacterized protein with gpF-like domain
MASRRKYRNTWLRWHGQYERRAYRRFIQVFKDWGNGIKWSDLNEQNYKELIKDGVNGRFLNEAYYDVYTTIGSKHGGRVGRDINREMKAFTPEAFLEVFLRDIVTYLQQPFLLRRIVTVEQTYMGAIFKMIQQRFTEGMGVEQIQREMRRIVNRPTFYRWQALRIARTETTAAANFGASRASTTSGLVTVKEWMSAQDARTRRIPKAEFDHYNMDGETVKEHEKFAVPHKWGGVDYLEYPGDPKGQPGNTINCRCTVVRVPLRDANGRLVTTG